MQLGYSVDLHIIVLVRGVGGDEGVDVQIINLALPQFLYEIIDQRSVKGQPVRCARGGKFQDLPVQRSIHEQASANIRF